jgi:catechol 2,3-dioxygenase-like lactoylglutathione lyase family enzyme
MTRLHHVGLTVSDLDVSIEFYCAVLGCTIRERSESGGTEVEALTGIAGARIRTADLEMESGAILELIQYLAPRAGTLAQLRYQPGHTHIGFQVEDIDAVYDRLTARGSIPSSRPVAINEAGSAWDGVRAIYACDPDGRTVECLELPSGETRSATG